MRGTAALRLLASWSQLFGKDATSPGGGEEDGRAVLPSQRSSAIHGAWLAWQHSLHRPRLGPVCPSLCWEAHTLSAGPHPPALTLGHMGGPRELPGVPTAETASIQPLGPTTPFIPGVCPREQRPPQLCPSGEKSLLCAPRPYVCPDYPPGFAAVPHVTAEMALQRLQGGPWEPVFPSRKGSAAGVGAGVEKGQPCGQPQPRTCHQGPLPPCSSRPCCPAAASQPPLAHHHAELGFLKMRAGSPSSQGAHVVLRQWH